jgi:hypothetical protein
MLTYLSGTLHAKAVSGGFLATSIADLESRQNLLVPDPEPEPCHDVGIPLGKRRAVLSCDANRHAVHRRARPQECNV